MFLCLAQVGGEPVLCTLLFPIECVARSLRALLFRLLASPAPPIAHSAIARSALLAQFKLLRRSPVLHSHPSTLPACPSPPPSSSSRALTPTLQTLATTASVRTCFSVASSTARRLGPSSCTN